jgi:hypothetical protein
MTLLGLQLLLQWVARLKSLDSGFRRNDEAP